MTAEDLVLAALDSELGTDRNEIARQTGLTLARVSGALTRLRAKGLARSRRWRETHVWWLADPDEPT